MSLVTIEEAVARLPELIQEIEKGEEFIVTRNDMPVARLSSVLPQRPRAKRGSHKGQVLYVAPDIDALPDGFEEHFS